MQSVVSQLPDLNGFFYPEFIDELAGYARNRVLLCFNGNGGLKRKEWWLDRGHIKCPGSPEDLAYHIASNRMNPIISERHALALRMRVEDGPAGPVWSFERLQKLVNQTGQHNLTKSIRQLSRDINTALVLMQVCQMYDVGALWTDEEASTWTVRQSEIDDLVRRGKSDKDAYFDRRNLHGRPRNQCEKRGLPPTSVGVSSSYAFA